jgi:hypothetical protein
MIEKIQGTVIAEEDSAAITDQLRSSSLGYGQIVSRLALAGAGAFGGLFLGGVCDESIPSLPPMMAVCDPCPPGGEGCIDPDSGASGNGCT